MRHLVWQIAASAIALTAIQWLFARALPAARQTPQSGVFGWELLANLLIAALLTYIATLLRADGPRLAVILFVFLFGVQSNSLIEAVFFQLDIPREELIKMVLRSLAVSASFALFLSWITGKWSTSAQAESNFVVKRSLSSWLWRILVCDASYLFLYFLAGMIVFPFVQDFYAAKALPSPLHVMLMQLFRGLVFTVLSVPMIQSMAAKRWRVAVLLGLALSIVGGIAPLLLPNPYMPGYVRWAHGWEVGISNFIFGCIMGWLMSRTDKVSL
ncbi:MAG TPA: hypothetical protein VGL91_01040 [Acidobacteriota bacterium]|jgi:hypothetical protein